MRKCLNLFAADADQWEADGMSLTDEDALVAALWKWYRGRSDTIGLSVTAKVLYSSITKRLEASEATYEARSRGGKIGMRHRWGSCKSVNKSVITEPITDGEYPTASSTSTSSSTFTSTTTDEAYVGNAPKTKRFIKPTVEEVHQYIAEMGYTNVDAENFIDYYESNGWKVGKVAMSDWRRTVSRWHRNATGKSVTEKPTFTQAGYTLRLGKESK